MDLDGSQAFVWRLTLVLLIFIPGSTLDGIEGSTATATTTPGVTTTATASEQRRPIDDGTILKTQSTTPSTAPSTAKSLVSSTTIGSASERGATDVSTPPQLSTKDSFNPSATTQPTTLTPPIAATTSTTSTTPPRAQVTIAGLWGSGAANDGEHRIANKDGSEGITDNSEDNGSSNKVENTNSSRDRQQRLLQKSKLLQQAAKGQEADFTVSKQYVRQVAPELPTTPTAADPTNNNLVDDAAVDELSTRSNHSDSATVSSADQSEKILHPEDPSADVANTTEPSSSSAPAAATTTFAAATTTAQPVLPHAVDGYQTIISQAGTHAYLPCNVKQLVKKPISWLRVLDGHILTVDQTTFIADQRFQSIYTPNPERWSLQIKYVQTKDAGSYECQVSTEPKTSAIVTLRIVEPKTELVGEETRHVKAGSPVRLRCIISQALEPPVFINWFYNQKQIYLHNRRGWRTEIERMDLPPEVVPTSTTSQMTTTTSAATSTMAVTSTASSATATTTTVRSLSMMKSAGAAPSLASLGAAHPSLSVSVGDRRATAALPAAAAAAFPTAAAYTTTTAPAADVRQITTASLIIASVEKQDSGNYTCSPSNSAPRTVVLHVLNGEYSASAITSGSSRSLTGLWPWFGAPAMLTLLWIISLLHSMAFGKQTDAKGLCVGAPAWLRLATGTTTPSTVAAIASSSTIPREPTEEKT